MKLFAELWCGERNLDIDNLNDEQINQLCKAWSLKSLGIEFKTIDEWRKNNE